MSILSRHSEKIQAKNYRKSLELCERKTRVLYYDCTNYFFEIEQEDALRRYGQSKQHQPSPLEKRILRDVELSEFIVCIDAGLTITEKRKYNHLHKRSYVVTQSIKGLKGHLKEWALDPHPI